jgi:raffinose/stachyose/melibiose transport system substrate-binding protein
MATSPQPASPTTRRPAGISRRLLITATASALFVTATACGSAVNTADGSSSDGLITLSMHNPDSKTQDPATWQMVQEFNKKHPDMKIKLEGQPVDQHEQRMTIAAQSGTLPEIFWVYDSLAKTMVKSGDLLDLTPVLAENDLKAKFAPSMLAGFRSGNVQYGLPYQALVTGFYYNKAILDEHKIAVPETFDELVAAVKKLKAAGVVPIAQGANNSSFSVWAFLTMLDRFGYESKYQDILSGKASYDNADFLRLYKHVEELAKAGAFPSNMNTQTYAQAVASYTDGKAAFLDAGVWEAAKIQKSTVGKDTGFWAGPTFSDGVGEQKLVMNVPSAPFVVSAKVKQEQEEVRRGEGVHPVLLQRRGPEDPRRQRPAAGHHVQAAGRHHQELGLRRRPGRSLQVRLEEPQGAARPGRLRGHGERHVRQLLRRHGRQSQP